MFCEPARRRRHCALKARVGADLDIFRLKTAELLSRRVHQDRHDKAWKVSEDR